MSASEQTTQYRQVLKGAKRDVVVPAVVAGIQVRELKEDHERYGWITQIAQSTSLPPNATRVCVLFAFDYFQGNKGTRQKPAKPFFPSHATIGKRLGLKEDTVQGIVAAVAREGFIIKWKAFGSSNRYKLCFPIPDGNPELEPINDPDRNPVLASDGADPRNSAPIPDKYPAQSRVNIRGNPISYPSGGDLPDHPLTTEADIRDCSARESDDDHHDGAPDGRHETGSSDQIDALDFGYEEPADKSPWPPSPDDIDAPEQDPEEAELSDEELEYRRNFIENFNSYSDDH